MSRLTKLFLLSLALAAPCAHADLEEVASGSTATAPAADVDVDNYYLGVGLFNDMLNLNVETVTDWGNFLVRAGTFGDGEAYGFNLSWRKPLQGDDPRATGYYAGLFGGHVVGEHLYASDELRLGAGIELGHHWVSDYTRFELTVGLGAAEPLEIYGEEFPAEPMLFFNVNWALGY